MHAPTIARNKAPPTTPATTATVLVAVPDDDVAVVAEGDIGENGSEIEPGERVPEAGERREEGGGVKDGAPVGSTRSATGDGCSVTPASSATGEEIGSRSGVLDALVGAGVLGAFVGTGVPADALVVSNTAAKSA